MPLSTAGSLGPAFATARPVGLAVKHPFALTLFSMIANHAEGTFELLRYTLGGNRPSQTDPLPRSLLQIHGNRLDVQSSKGGISLGASITPDEATSLAPTYSTHQ
jgi:hypothetical protein